VTLWKRILVEKRPFIAPIALALLINIGVYAFVVYPLGVKITGAAVRAERATTSLRAAEADFAAARALVTGTTRADQELATFYDKVLPADFSSARHLTAATIPQLAKKANVKFAGRRTEIDDKDAKRTGLARLLIHVVLEGDYENLRRFIYELESSPDFVIIDAVALSQADPAKPLNLAVDLSTYFRPSANGN
jgi:type II secretion system (T2SS) protein M